MTEPLAADAPADLDEAVRQLAGSYPDLPVAAMRWALDNWAVAGPRFLAMLRARADGGPADEAQDEALYFAIHLLAEQRETAACQPLCRLLLDVERTGEVFGDEVDLPVPRRMVALARERGLLLHAHSDIAAVEGLFRQWPQARILWAHAGFETPQRVREVLRRHPALWCALVP